MYEVYDLVQRSRLPYVRPSKRRKDSTLSLWIINGIGSLLLTDIKVFSENILLENITYQFLFQLHSKSEELVYKTKSTLEYLNELTYGPTFLT